jgi:hypothetical protein
MTAKQAIKARCKDCLAGSRECTFTDCAHKGLAKAKGKVSKKTILAYCRWCLNGHPFKVCSSPDCAIYQYRREREAALKTPRICIKQGGTEGVFSKTEEKPYKPHGKEAIHENSI